MKLTISKKIFKIIFIFAAIIIVFEVGFLLGKQNAPAPEPFFTSQDFSIKHFKLFWNTWTNIKDNYIEQKNISADKAAYEASRGLVRSLGDPYSDLFDEEKGKMFTEDLQGSFGGVGMEISEKDGLITVVAPLEGTPAEKAGVHPGDIILKIDGKDAQDLGVEEAVAKIRGPVGTEVTVTIAREGWREPKDITLVRAQIEIAAVKSKLYEPDIGYIKINTFNTKTISEFVNAYNDVTQKGARKYIIDLRNNPGGFLDVAVSLSEFFIPRGEIVLRELWGPQKKEKRVVSEGPGVLDKAKVVILINKGSASASEIFTGALRDDLKTPILGEKSFGKGSVQQIYNVDGDMLKLTVGYWLTPSGQRLEGDGITPSMKIKDSNLSDDVDEVLNKTIEYIKTL